MAGLLVSMLVGADAEEEGWAFRVDSGAVEGLDCWFRGMSMSCCMWYMSVGMVGSVEEV